MSIKNILGTFVFTFFCFSLSAQNLKFTHLTVKDGLSNNTITCFLQDSKGFMWIGTTDGLNKYNGYSFEIYRHQVKDKFSLQSNYIYDLYEDKNQDIWVATNGGGLYRYDNKYNRFLKEEAISSASVKQIIEDTDGKLWIAAGNTLFQRNATSQKFTPFYLFSKDNINAFLQIDRDWLAIATSESGLLLLNTKTKQVKQFTHQDSDRNTICNNTIRSIYKDIEGKIWIGTANGLDRFDVNNNRFEHFTISEDTSKSLLISSLLFIKGNGQDIWIGTENGGLSKYNLQSKQFVHYLHDNANVESINDNSIYSIYIDRQKRLWAGTFSSGINIADPNSEKFRKPNIVLKNQTVNAIFKDSKNRLWVGTEEGLAVKKDNNTSYYTHNPADKNALPSNPVLEVFEDNRGQIWVGTWTGGLSIFDEGKNQFRNFTIDPSDPTKLPNANILDITQHAQNQQVLVASFGGFHIISPDTLTSITTYTHNPSEASSISSNQCRLIYEDKSHKIWIGTNQGLNQFDIDTKKFIRYLNNKEDSNSISHNSIRSIFQDSRGNLWVGTVDGLNKMLKDGKFTSFTTLDGLPSNTINAILEDEKGNLWLSTNNGISCFNPDKKTFRNYDEGDGLQSNQFKSDSYFQSRDGEMFFGGVSGLNAFYPREVRDNPNIPSLFLTDFKLFNQSIKIGDYDSLLKQHISGTKEITLNHTQSIFSIDFVALNLTQSYKNQYAYRLEGLEETWNYVGTQRIATYTSLDAGTYTFRVKASNNDGKWNEAGISLQINILPPWWATWWFRLSSISLLLISAYSFYKVRTNFLKKQNLKLERQVIERTQQVVERTQEIEKKSKEVELANYQIKIKNEELLVSEEELRQNMEELETNQELLKSQKEQLEYAFQELHKQNTKVNDSIRYAQRIQNAILPHEDILASAFAEHFVIFKPKDVVSGDFYWYFEIQNRAANRLESKNLELGMNTITNEQLPITNDELPMTNNQLAISNEQLPINTEKQNKEQPNYSTIQLSNYSKKKFLAVVDCTGHGVPGAFMSMIGNTLLREIIESKKIYQPAQILNELNKSIINSLNSKGKSFQDGMDIVLCCFENTPNGQVKLTYAGAKRTLYYFDTELHEIKGDHTSIGHKADSQYTQSEQILQSNTTLFLTTDGWIDSINPERKRFGSQRFKEMLLKAANLPLYAQKEVFTTILEEYEQGTEQRDDVLMVGVRV
jgi:ligand-binding sensor domain-containing protein/serine phosphatase RsbU (regulator of sigma subunit)